MRVGRVGSDHRPAMRSGYQQPEQPTHRVANMHRVELHLHRLNPGRRRDLRLRRGRVRRGRPELFQHRVKRDHSGHGSAYGYVDVRAQHNA